MTSLEGPGSRSQTGVDGSIMTPSVVRGLPPFSAAAPGVLARACAGWGTAGVGGVGL